MFDCFVYIRQDATQSYLEVPFYSIGIISELQKCSYPVSEKFSTSDNDESLLSEEISNDLSE